MSLNKILASIAIVLALLAAIVGTPTRNDVDVNSIATLIETEQDHVTPLELAEQLYAGKRFRLIDLRDSASFAAQRIVNAERMTIPQLLNGAVKRNETIVLYSEGGIHASQAWMMLKMKRYDSVYTLLGGFAGWERMVLRPVLKKEDEHRRMLSHHFGGTPSVAGDEPLKKEVMVKQKKTIQPAPQPPAQFKQEEEKLRDQC